MLRSITTKTNNGQASRYRAERLQRIEGFHGGKRSEQISKASIYKAADCFGYLGDHFHSGRGLLGRENLVRPIQPTTHSSSQRSLLIFISRRHLQSSQTCSSIVNIVIVIAIIIIIIVINTIIIHNNMRGRFCYFQINPKPPRDKEGRGEA